MFTHPYPASQLSFRRIIDIPLQACVAALDNGQRAGPHTDLHLGPSLLRGPIQHDRHTGTYHIDVRLARGPLRPLLPMRLHLDPWWGPPARTALELSPGTRVRPAAAYFRAGHLLLDALTRRLVTVTDLNDLHREDPPAAAAALSAPDTSVAVPRAIPPFHQGSPQQGSGAARHSDVGGERENLMAQAVLGLLAAMCRRA